MAKANLHDDGWRQGSLIRATLKAVVLDNDGTEQQIAVEHDLWLLATQDCDLFQTKSTDKQKRVELRPVYAKEPSDVVDGIRSKTAKVSDDLVLRADSPRVMLTARALTSLKDKSENTLDDKHRRGIKTWLGLRYDRPAVPDSCVPVWKTILQTIGQPQAFDGNVRDVLVYYHENPREVNLFIVLKDGSDGEAVKALLDDKVAELLDTGIVVKGRYVRDSTQTPLSVIETYYSLYADELSLTSHHA